MKNTKKIFIMLMVILCLMVVPMTAFAADETAKTDIEKLGSTDFVAELDTAEVTEIRYAGDYGATLYTDSQTNSKIAGRIDKDTVLYIDEVIKAETEDGIGTIWKAISEVGSGYVAPMRTIVKSSNGGSAVPSNNNASGGSSGGGSYKITYYCSACNSPRGSNTVALSGSHAYVGSCASNSFPLGSTIYIEGYGTYFVNDRMGRSGVIDIYMGDRDTCTCSGTGYANAYVVG